MVELIPDDTPALKTWRGEVRSFLEEALPGGFRYDYDYDEDPEKWQKGVDFWKKVGRRGWIALTWPKQYYGQERSAIEKWILFEEFCRYDVPAYPVIGFAVADNILRLGTHEQRLRHLKGIAEASALWAEGYTEPGSGSDLATLTTRAHREGDEWVLNGQKTFGTASHKCDWMSVLARTDPSATKHGGITCFLVPLNAKGISMTPLHNLAGGRQNHTFFDNVRLPADAVLGDVNQAWNQVWFRIGGEKLDRAGPTMVFHAHRILNMLDRMVRYCKETVRQGKPLSEDPLVRHRLAELLLDAEGIRLLWYDNFSRFASNSRSSFGEAARHLEQTVFKEFWPKLGQALMEIAGPMAQLHGGKWAELNGEVEYFYRTSFGNHAGGTSQVKRMVLATRGLGLPR